MKQVIVIRKDLKMRRGKECSQASHASMAFITRRFNFESTCDLQDAFVIELKEVEKAWLKDSFAKVCVRVDSEEHLLEIEKQAKEAGLEVHLVVDSGLTEFHGVPTPTCLAIGPDEPDKIDVITGELKLY